MGLGAAKRRIEELETEYPERQVGYKIVKRYLVFTTEKTNGSNTSSDGRSGSHSRRSRESL